MNAGFLGTNARRIVVAIGAALLLAGPLVLSLVESIAKGGWAFIPSAIAFAWIGVTIFMPVSRTWGGFFAASWPVTLLAPAFAWYYASFRGYPDDNAVMVLMTSTPGEAIGWIGALGLWPWLAASMLQGIAFATIAWLLRHEPLPPRLRRLQVASIVPAFAIALLVPFRGGDGAFHVAPSDALYIHLTSSYPLGGWLSTIASWKEAMQSMGVGTSKRAFGAHYASDDRTPETHVLVIGESARYDAFGMHGYARDTSGSLSAIPGLVSYSRAYAPANVTYLSVPMILTGIGPVEYRRDEIRGTLVDAMREAGYRTAWLSNQENYIARLLAPPADRWCVPADLQRIGWERTLPDAALLPCLDQELQLDTPKRFIVLHTYGSHWDYAKRLPDDSFHYSGLARASASNDMTSASDPERLRRDLYDDTIAYTSWFLAQIIARLQNVPGRVSFTYVSDHGESFLYTEGIGGHGMPRFSIAEAHIPLLFWANQGLMHDRAALWRNVVSHRTAIVRGDSLFATVAALSGVTIPGIDPRKDLTSDSFESPDDLAEVAMLCGGRLTRLANAVDWRPP